MTIRRGAKQTLPPGPHFQLLPDQAHHIHAAVERMTTEPPETSDNPKLPWRRHDGLVSKAGEGDTRWFRTVRFRGWDNAVARETGVAQREVTEIRIWRDMPSPFRREVQHPGVPDSSIRDAHDKGIEVITHRTNGETEQLVVDLQDGHYGPIAEAQQVTTLESGLLVVRHVGEAAAHDAYASLQRTFATHFENVSLPILL